MNKLLLLTSVLTLIFTSFSFAKTYSIKKEKEGKYVEISQGDIEVVLSKGEVFQQQISGNSFINIIKYDNIRSNISHYPAFNKAWSKGKATAKACQGEGEKR